jgi:acylphosphatase
MSNIDWSAISGALIGSFFYTLMKLQPYLENRTFDPKYNSAYLARLVTGIVAGVILAYFLKDWLYASSLSNSLKNLSTGSIGILGGFSAEAVEELLQRVKDVLLSLVRGDNSAQIQAKANAQQNAKLADVRDKLGDIDKAKTDDEKKAATDAAKALLKRSAS